MLSRTSVCLVAAASKPAKQQKKVRHCLVGSFGAPPNPQGSILPFCHQFAVKRQYVDPLFVAPRSFLALVPPPSSVTFFPRPRMTFVVSATRRLWFVYFFNEKDVMKFRIFGSTSGSNPSGTCT
jgi:hypothetical protein